MILHAGKNYRMVLVVPNFELFLHFLVQHGQRTNMQPLHANLVINVFPMTVH